MCDLDGCGIPADLPDIKIDREQRRLFLQGLASLPLASVLAFPELAQAAAATSNEVSISLPDGSSAKAAIALPKAGKGPAVLLIHEWWGLNDQIKTVAAELASQGYVALAVDLYNNQVASDPAGAKALMQAVDPAQATATLTAWVDYLRKHESSTGKIATMGWCFGGGWSLNCSIATPVDATIIYYGSVTRPSADLKNLQGPVLGHFGKKDKRINDAMVSGFEKEMASAGKDKNLTVHWYDADHAFANPTGARYDEKNAALAWERSMAFLKENLGS